MKPSKDLDEQIDEIRQHCDSLGVPGLWYDRLIEIVLADRKKYELQARIDELEQVEEDPWGVQHIPKPREYRNGYTVGVKSVEERLGELQQELEKL